MTLKEIEAFYWTAVLSNFSLAAAKLHITQSSLSKRVAELEASVGVPLFERSSKKVQLTDSGARLLPIARQFLDLADSMQAEAVATTRLSGECKFGISELIALTWLPGLVNSVRQRHPGLKLQPYVDLARGLERRVVRGELDFAVAPGPAESSALVSEDRRCRVHLDRCAESDQSGDGDRRERPPAIPADHHDRRIRTHTCLREMGQ